MAAARSILCAPFVAHHRNGVSATVFAAKESADGVTVLFALDNTSGGVLAPLLAVDQQPNVHPMSANCNGVAAPAQHVPHGSSYSDHPSLGWALVKPSRGNACNELEVAWPSLRLRVNATLCHVARRPVYSTACSYVYVSPRAKSATLAGVVRWAQAMDGQVDRLQLSVLNSGPDVRDALTRAVPDLMSTGRLELLEWNWIESLREATGLDMPDDAFLITGVGTGAHKNRPAGINPKHARDWAWSKCILEQRGATTWTMIMDVDESWGTNDSRVTLGGFLRGLNPSTAQYLFCEAFRSKPALRLDKAPCNWLGYPHLGVATSSSPAWCGPTDHEANRFRHHDPVVQRLEYFRTGPGCHPQGAERPAQWIEHDRFVSPERTPWFFKLR